jgi:hypothetical protein
MARLFVIPARDEPVAVILRRGPSRWYHVILWDTRRDHFTNGAWIKGRIYEEKCDLSPDGKLFVYFVHQGSRGGTEFTDAWTAVSRPPWLYALGVWPQGTTYGGGGRFLDKRRLALRPLWHDPLRDTHPDHPARGLEIIDAAADLHHSTAEIPEADWCGRDQSGRLIYTKGGRLMARTPRADHILADFTLLRPNPEPAPEWARRPL